EEPSGENYPPPDSDPFSCGRCRRVAPHKCHVGLWSDARPGLWSVEPASFPKVFDGVGIRSTVLPRLFFQLELQLRRKIMNSVHRALLDLEPVNFGDYLFNYLALLVMSSAANPKGFPDF